MKFVLIGLNRFTVYKIEWQILSKNRALVCELFTKPQKRFERFHTHHKLTVSSCFGAATKISVQMATV